MIAITALARSASARICGSETASSPEISSTPISPRIAAGPRLPSAAQASTTARPFGVAGR